MPIEIGLVGCGNAARGIHHPPLSARPDKFKVTACCDLDPARAEAIGSLYGAQPYTALDRFLAHPGLRLVLVATRPPATHAPIALAALAAGKDVLVEKPMCDSIADGQAMIDGARRAGRLLTVHQNRRWEPDFIELRWMIEQGLFGAVRFFDTRVCGNLLAVDWLFDWGAHLFDQALLVGAGQPVEVSCAAAFPRGPDGPSGPWTAFVRFDTGCVATAAMMPAGAGVPRFVVAGDRGGCAWPPAKGRLTLTDTELVARLPELCRGRDAGGAPVEPSRDVRIPMTPFYDNLHDALEGRAELAVKPEEALRAVQVCLAALESARTGRTVLVGPMKRKLMNRGDAPEGRDRPTEEDAR